MIKRVVFFVLLGLYLISLWYKFYIPQNSWVNHYQADFLCMPIVLMIAEKSIQILKRNSTFKLSLLQIGVGAIYFSVLFELVLPALNEKYTQDPKDVLMYFLGAGLFTIIQMDFQTRFSKTKKV